MDVFSEFLREYGTTLLYTLVTAIFGYLGIAAKKLCQSYLNSREKEKAARTVVKAIEQIYTELHGAQKLEKALSDLDVMLSEKGIAANDLELRLLLESALAEYNKAFEKEQKAAPETAQKAA